MQKLNVRFLALLLLSSLRLTAQDAQIPYELLNKLTDSNGKLKLQFELGNLMTRADKFPIVIAFGSGDASKSQILPKGWSIPLIDSSIYQESEFLGKYMLPTGEIIPFQIDGDGVSIKGGGGITGTISGGKTIKIKSPDYEIEFKDGRIKSFANDKGRVDWFYDGVTLTKIITDADELSVKNSMQGIIGELKLKSSTTDGIVSYTKSSVSNEQLNTMGMNSVSEISHRAGGMIFERSDEASTGSTKMILTNKKENAAHSFQWNSMTGVVSQIDDLLYEVTRFTPKTALPQIRVFSKVRGWKVLQQGYDYDDGKSLMTNYLVNGDKEYVYYVDTLKGLQVRKKMLEKADGTKVETYRANFKEDGQLLKDSGMEFERRNVDGRVLVFKDGKLQYEY